MRRGWLALAVCLTGCAVQGDPPADEHAPRGGTVAIPPPTMSVPAPIKGAHCEVDVKGTVVDIENDYLPNVIACENGGANLEALKAQAIAARSVAYYAIERDGTICDSQGCQVYTCDHATPGDLEYQAVNETSGQYLMFNGTLTYAFYVAGDSSTDPPSCVGQSGSTEHFVTYNSGLTGTDVEQTTLGLVIPPGDSAYGQNRGCMSQWGARCLENDLGRDYLDILRFYYGEDIIIDQALGECVIPTGGSSSGGDDTTGGSDPVTTDPSDPSAGEESSTSGDVMGTGGGSASATDPSAGSDPSGNGSDPTNDSDASASATQGSSGADDGEALPDDFGESDGNGCGCSSDDSRTPWGALALLALFARRRRRA